MKGDIILSHMCANFQVQKHFRSRDIGAKGVKNNGLPYLTKVVITRERLKIAFDIMAFLESA